MLARACKAALSSHWRAPARSRSLAAQAARAGGEKKGQLERRQPRRPEEERTLVTFRVPGQAPTRFERISQAGLDEYLRLEGAKGFLAATGNVSRSLADLPEGGAVDLQLPEKLSIEAQVGLLRSTADNITLAKEQQLCAFLQEAARTEHPDSPITVLPTEPFKGPNKQHFVQLDAALKVDNELLVGEHKIMLGEDGVADLQLKLTKIRAALTRGSSPDLAAALQGVTHVRLFLAGEAVRAGLAVDELVNLAAAAGMSVVLPSGQALGLAAEPAPAVPL